MDGDERADRDHFCASRRAVNSRFRAAMRGKAQGNYITFASPTLLWRILAAKRMEMLQAVTGQGPLTIRKLSRLVRRDVKSVHGDVGILVSAGVLDKTEDGDQEGDLPRFLRMRTLRIPALALPLTLHER